MQVDSVVALSFAGSVSTMKTEAGKAAVLALLQRIGDGYRHLSMFRCKVGGHVAPCRDGNKTQPHLDTCDSVIDPIPYMASVYQKCFSKWRYQQALKTKWGVWSQEAIAAFIQLEPEQYSTGWVLCCVGRAYYEMVDYQQAARVFEWARMADPTRLQVCCVEAGLL